MGFIASTPTICDFPGDILSGTIPDALFRHGTSLSMVRRVPIMLDMLFSMAMMIRNHVDAQTVAVAMMVLSFFGKGLSALGRAVNSDTTPK